MIEILKTVLKQVGTPFDDLGNEIRIPVNSFICSNENLLTHSQDELLLNDHLSELWYQESIVSIQWDEVHQEFNWAIFEDRG